jgi:hypothetical protein
VSRTEADLGEGRAPLWAFGVSWALWLAITGAAVWLIAHKIERHEAALVTGRREWSLRYELCKRLSQAPRPSWQECLVRAANVDEPNLLAHRSGVPNGS